MGVLAQMLAVDRVVRDPAALPGLLAGGPDGLAPADAEVLATVDRARLEAVADSQALALLGRWWAPRFPGAIESATAALGDPTALARALCAAPSFERAEGEDRTGAALVHGLLDLAAAGRTHDAPWLEELLAYEYLLEVGLPLRARGEPVDAALEARLLGPRATWLAGGRLRGELVALACEWPVGAWHEGQVDDDEPDPRLHVLGVLGDEVVEVEVSPQARPALELLAQGAPDEQLAARIGRKNTGKLLGWLSEAGLLVDPRRRRRR